MSQSQNGTVKKVKLDNREIKVRKFGNCERYDFSRIEDVLEIPYLVEIQKNSYETFLKEGIKDVLDDYSPICDYSGKIELHFLEHSLDGISKYGEKECKNRDATYASPLKVKVRLVNTETGEMKDQEVFMGDFPLMTDNGSFIINGAERVIVSQLVRSPGVYCDNPRDKNGEFRYATTIIPTRGAWLEFEEDINGVLWVHVDRTRKVTATILLKSLGLGSDDEILALFHDDPVISATLDKDGPIRTQDEALVELNKRLRPGEVPSSESVKAYLNALLYDPKKYDLARVGRYKFNKKLSVARRITGTVSCEDIVVGGETLWKKGDVITEDKAIFAQNHGINEVRVHALDNDKEFVVMGNNTADLEATVDCDPKSLGILEKIHYPTLVALLAEANAQTEQEKADVVRAHITDLNPKHIIIDDIIAAINYTVGLHAEIGMCDNIDHLGNRRVRSVGELLQNQFRIGIVRLERVIKERMQIQDTKELTPTGLINIKPVSSAIKEFFGSSQLSQFMDQTNPISELTHKRKLSALGPGGLNRERASFEVRDVHYTHYGRMCPIETPEGQNIGLISSLSTFARVNNYGFIEAPYRKVFRDEQGKKFVSEHVDYLSADDEDRYVVAQASEPLDENNWFVNERVMMRYLDIIAEIDREKVEYMDVSPRQLVSVATALIPFLENDDTNRALMGSNMQRQAVPLIKPEAPIIATGMEATIAYDSGVMILTKEAGVVEFVDADRIMVRTDSGKLDTYDLLKFQRSNQGTCVNQHPLARKGDRVEKGAVLADGHSTQNSELALGRNILIGFMSWEGYNYEDAILISEDLVKEDVFTSIHIEEYEMEARDTKLGPEDITRDIPNVGEEALKDLDEDGVIRIGADVRSNDILVGKVTPKGETDLTPEERLLRAIFGEKARDVRDTSLRVPHGEGGIVVDVKVFTRANKDELKPGVHKLVRVYIAQKRKISVGDKMAGRHGNKGVISRILPREDMPFMADGTPLQIVLNPLGVPSRMNIGQVLEVHLGLVAKYLGWHVATPVFDGATEQDIEYLFKQNNVMTNDKVDGKIELYDGRTGMPFENRVTVGYMYMLKLIHLVDDKIHARSTGPYSLVTQQPLGGKAQFGGQRFGEMEVWALYAYGAANILQEIMTIKSDDVVGRVKAFDAIVKGQNIPDPGVPESFKVLIKELQALGLDVKVLSEKNEELDIKDIIEDDRDMLPYDSELPGRRLPEDDEFADTGLTLSLDDFDDDEDDELSLDTTPGSIFEHSDDELGFIDDLSEGLDEEESEDDLDDLEDLGLFGGIEGDDEDGDKE